MSTRKMHTDEVSTDEFLVRRLVDAQFPQWARLPIEPVPSAGTSNALYRLGDKMVVRLPRTPSASKQIDKEQQWLPRLAPFLPLDIPYPLAAGLPAEKYPWHWSIYSWLEGLDASFATVSDEHQTALVLAEFILALHQIDPTGGPAPGKHNFLRGEPLAKRDKETRAAMTSLQGRFDLDRMNKVWYCSLETPVWSDTPCWIHGDLIPTNLLVHKGMANALRSV